VLPITEDSESTSDVIAPEEPLRHRWVSGRELAELLSPLSAEDQQSWSDDLALSRDTTFGRDFWEKTS